jgi:MFS family permease
MGTLTTAMLSTSRTRKAMVGIIGAFFIQGFLAVTWLPRIPEIIDNLGVPFGVWGLTVAISGLGGLLPLLFANKLINRFGSRPLLQVSFLTACMSVATFGFIHNPAVFFVALFAQNFSYGVYNIVVNSHSVVFQNRIGRIILGRFHAAWSIGAASSSLLTGLFAVIVPLHLWLTIVAGICAVVGTIAIAQMLSPKEDGHEQEQKRAASVPLFKTPKYVLVMGLCLFFGVMPEVVMMDWSAVFAKTTMHLATDLQGMPYTLFVVAMIVGRLAVGKLSRRRHLSRIAQIGATGSAVAISAAVIIGTLTSQISPMFALAATAIFWIIAGLGNGPQVPATFSNVSTVDSMTTAQAMSRMSLMNSLIIMVGKILLGAIAQGIGVEFVYMVSVMSLAGAALIHRYLVARAKRMPVPAGFDDQSVDAFPITSPLAVISETEIPKQ